MRELGTLRREIKSRLLKKGYANVRMVDLLEVCGAAASVEAARALMVDQVHMTAAGYGYQHQGVGSCMVAGEEEEQHGFGSTRCEED